MGIIFKAKDNNLDKICVIKKMVVAEYVDDEQRRKAVQDFKNEAKLLSMLNHPKIPRVTDYFADKSDYYLVMDYIEGKNLEELIVSQYPKGLPESMLMKWAKEIIDLFIYLHSQNPPLIHRDLKPANIIISNENKLWLVDFGIAKRLISKKTGTGIGTAGYAPPEQYKGKTQICSEIYSFGATLHHLITGKDPTQGTPFDFPDINSFRPDFPKNFAKIIKKCLEMNVRDRYNSFGELKTAFEKLEGQKKACIDKVTKRKKTVQKKVEATPEKKTRNDDLISPDKFQIESINCYFDVKQNHSHLMYQLKHNYSGEYIQIEQCIVKIFSRAFPSQGVSEVYYPSVRVSRNDRLKFNEIRLNENQHRILRLCGEPHGVAIKVRIEAKSDKGEHFTIPMDWELNWDKLAPITDRIILSIVYYLLF